MLEEQDVQLTLEHNIPLFYGDGVYLIGVGIPTSPSLYDEKPRLRVAGVFLIELSK